MELTQKLEYTQELFTNNSEKEFPEQIGFLGICGVKYPLKKGPNKIGRDPETCNIVLNLNSISRQHAVINILNSYDFMLMDLDSANKTKLADKTLNAYIPHPIKNGDMVQFGEVFGVFRLFEENNELPMTQALDMPETPVRNQAVSKVNNLITTIPESPDVSDRDDSFIVPSQPKQKNVFKSPNTNFIKPSGRTVSIKPVGLNKIDNAYWNSSRKSDSFDLEYDASKNDSDLCLKTSETNQNIHEQDTQLPVPNKTTISIHEAETQLPDVDNLPEVCKVQGQENVDIDLFTENKENEINTFNCEAEDTIQKETTGATGNVGEEQQLEECSSKNCDVSDDIILFDEIDSPSADEDVGSQQLLISELDAEHVASERSATPSKEEKSRSNRRDSGSSTDCEDIYFALTQNVPEKRIVDDETDCEDDEITKEANKETIGNFKDDGDLTDCENLIEDQDQENPLDNIEDLATQIIEDLPSNCDENTETMMKQITSLHEQPHTVDEDKNLGKDKDEVDLEDMPTQVMNRESHNITSEDVFSSFKIPIISPFKRKKKDEEAKVIKIITGKNITTNIDNGDEENYYAATQEILNDLCTQRSHSPILVSVAVSERDVTKAHTTTNNDNPKAKSISGADDIDEKIDRFVTNLTNSELSNVGVEKEMSASKASSGSSDIESTPKKLKPLSFFDIELPNTQEIKTYVKATGETSTDTSLESDTDGSDFETRTKTRDKNAKNAKRTDLSIELEPERIITRTRKATSKTQNCDTIKKSKKILQFPILENDRDGTDKEAVLGKITHNKEKSKRNTRKSDNKNNNENQGSNKSKEHNDNRNIEKINRSKETNKSRSKNNTENGNTSKESNNNRGRNNVDNNNKCNVTKRDKSNDSQRSRGKAREDKNLKKYNPTGNNDIEKESEQQETRKSRRTKEKQKEVKKDNKDSKPKTDEAKPRETRTSNSNRTRSESNRKESNTIEKYLCAAPVNEAQTKEKEKISAQKGKRTTEKVSKENVSIRAEREGKSTEKGNRSTKKASKDMENVSSSAMKRNRSAEKANKDTEKGSNSIEKGNRSTKKGSKDMENLINSAKKESRSAETGIKDEENASISAEKRSSRTRNKETEKREPSIESEVRRSKRKRTAKKSFEIETKSIKSQASKHEQSAVYNLSTESGVNSPNKLKRPGGECSLPSAKKTKPSNSSKVTLRATPRKSATQYVLFTAFPCDEVRIKLEKLGAVVVSDIMDCTVVLTLQIKRTFKLLCAVGLGKPIVGPNWVQACVDTNMIVDPWSYLIKDEETERRFQFNLEHILRGRREFLKGYNVSSTPHVMPSPAEMKLIVECSGGTWTVGGKNWICVSSITDKALWTALKRKGATIVTTEFILAGVLRQKIDIGRNVLA